MPPKSKDLRLFSPRCTFCGTALLQFAAVLFALLLPAAAHATAIASTVVFTITSPTTMYFGQSVDGYASVTTTDGSTPTGNITFYDGTTDICQIPVSPMSSCPASTGTGFTVGIHSLTAVYSGDATHTGSTSNAVVLTVLANPTAVSLASSSNPATAGQPVTLTAVTAGSYTQPTGSVTFLDGTNPIGTAALNSSGVATLTTASLSTGSHSLTASYAGDGESTPGTSPVLTETINPAPIQSTGDFSITVSGPTTVGVGRDANLTVTVTPHPGFDLPVDLSCAHLPTESACTFGQHTIPASGGTTTLQISTIAPHDCGSSTPYFLGAGFAVFLLPFGKRKRLRGLIVALVALGGTVSALTGCGTCTDLGTRPGTYSIQVIGTPTASPNANAQSADTASATIAIKVVL